MMTELSSDGVPFVFLAAVFLYGAVLALWAQDWPELALRGTIALALVAFTLLGYANELRLLDEPTVRALFWWGLLIVLIVLAGLRWWTRAARRRPEDASRLTRAASPWPGRQGPARRP